jgi:uncharacterized protein YjbI with pentapeptide repeats
MPALAVEAAVPEKLKPLWPGESFFLEHLTADQETPVDLALANGQEQPPESRKVRAKFLQALLTEKIKKTDTSPGGVQLKNAVITGELNLAYGKVPMRLDLEKCIFEDEVIFRDTHFQKELRLAGCQFAKRFICQARIETNAVFDGSVFFQEARFYGADIGSELSATGAIFKGAARFAGISVKKNAYFLENTVFEQLADFNGARIGDDLMIRARFAGKAIFRGITVGRDLFANGAKFMNPKEETEFVRLEVKRLAKFDGAVFAGEVDFSKAKVGEGLREEKLGATLEGTVFQKKVRFDGAHFSDLNLTGSKGQAISLAGVVIDQELRLVDLKVAALSATYLQVKGPAEINGLTIAEAGDFTASHFQALKLEGSKPPQPREKFLINGMTYQSLTLPPREKPLGVWQGFHNWMLPGSWEEQLKKPGGIYDWVTASHFDSQNYRQLESYFKRCGYEDLADDVYIDMKRVENSGRNVISRWAIGVLWDGMAGYGRKPYRIFLGGAFFFLLGMALFKTEYVEGGERLLKIRRSHRLVSQAFISLDHLLPGLDLGFVGKWNFGNMPLSRICYFIGHRLMGYVLLSIAIATLLASFK